MDEKPVRWPESACTAARVWERVGGPDGSPESANDGAAPAPQESPAPQVDDPYPFMREPGYDTKAFEYWEAQARAATGAEKALLYQLMSECAPTLYDDGTPAWYWCFPRGVEDLGDTPPGRDLSHPAYGTLRRIAWRYRDKRNDDQQIMLDIAMQWVAERIKARPGVAPEDVDRVVNCLKADRCGCDRCRYSW